MKFVLKSSHSQIPCPLFDLGEGPFANSWWINRYLLTIIVIISNGNKSHSDKQVGHVWPLLQQERSCKQYPCIPRQNLAPCNRTSRTLETRRPEQSSGAWQEEQYGQTPHAHKSKCNWSLGEGEIDICGSQSLTSWLSSQHAKGQSRTNCSHTTTGVPLHITVRFSWSSVPLCWLEGLGLGLL